MTWPHTRDLPYLDMRTLELPQEAAVIGEHHHVELVAVRVPDEDVTSICRQTFSTMVRNVSSVPDISIPLGKLVMFSPPILRTNWPSSENTTTLWPLKSHT